MKVMLRFVFFTLLWHVCMMDSWAQTKFSANYGSSDFESTVHEQKFDFSSLNSALKSSTPSSAGVKSFVPHGLTWRQSPLSNDKSIVLNRIMEDTRTVWIEVAPSKSVTKSGALINRVYKLLEELHRELAVDTPLESLHPIKITDDKMGESHIRMAQTHRGIPVINGELIVHTSQGEPYLINSDLKTVDHRISLIPSVSPARAEQLALQHAEGIEIADHLLQYVGGQQSDSELSIYVDKEAISHLVYKITLYPNLSERWIYLINAHNGELIHKHPNSCKFHHHIERVQGRKSIDISGPESTNGADLGGQNVQVSAYEEGGLYYLLNISENMFDAGRSSLPHQPVGGILTLNAKNTTPQNNSFSVDHIVSNSATWNAPIAVTAHNNARTVYRYYNQKFGLNSFDNRGSTILSFINVADEDGLGMDNAFWNGNGMYYGNGREAFRRSLAASLDVAAHELSHGVIQYTANLNYENESGALNESFADIFAVLIERKNYAIGEDVVNTALFPTGALRSMSNPNNGGTRLGDIGWQPSSVSQQYFGSEDNGGVHINSGIPNHAFYLFSSDNRAGVEIAEAVYFKALRDYLTASSNFKALRRAIGQSILDLYGNDANIMAAFNEAFDRVGIESTDNNQPVPDPVVTYEANPGEDFIIWYNESRGEINIRFLSNGSDVVLSQKGLLNKPSVSDDGRLLLFIGADSKMYAIIFNWQANQFEERLIDSRSWRNVAISKDGNKLAALMGNLNNNEFDNRMLIIDFVSETEQLFTLTNPTTAAGISTSDVQFADAIQWDHTSEFVMYDAFNEVSTLFSNPINYWDIGFIKVWDNQTNRFDEGQIFKLFPSLPENISIGNPTFSNLSSDRIALDVLDTNGGDEQYLILGVNLETGSQGVIFDSGNVPGYPNYSRTDEELLFNFNNNSASSEVPIIATRAIATDGITGTGDALVKINRATWGTWFSNGVRDLTTATVDADYSKSIILYPNPTADRLQLSHEDLQCTSCSVEIIDITGKAVIGHPYEDHQIIDVSSLQSGFYTLKIIDRNKAYTKLFVKK